MCSSMVTHTFLYSIIKFLKKTKSVIDCFLLLIKKMLLAWIKKIIIYSNISKNMTAFHTKCILVLWLHYFWLEVPAEQDPFSLGECSYNFYVVIHFNLMKWEAENCCLLRHDTELVICLLRCLQEVDMLKEQFDQTFKMFWFTQRFL